MRSSVNPQWTTVALASLGSSLEIYDFIIFGIFAREIATAFFPGADPVTGLLRTFGVFAVGYVSRPLGGIVLSSLGDRYGRRILLLVSVLAMSGATIAIGLLPAYHSIGIAAPICLVALRMTQGFFLAGETPCAITYVVEEMPNRAGLVTGAVIFCTNTGVLIATLTSLAIHSTLTPAGVADVGWRIAFCLGGVIGLLSYWVRTSLEESREFKKIKSSATRRPFRQLIRDFRAAVLVGIGVACVLNVSNSLLFVVLPSYLTTVMHYDATIVSWSQNIGIATMSVSLLVVGWLSDRIPSRYLHRAGACCLFIGGYPFYQAVAAHQLDLRTAFMVMGLVGGLVAGTFAYLLADQFPTRVRFSGVALSLNLSTVLFTGLTPFAVTSIQHATGLPAAPGIYLSGVALVAFAAGFASKRTGGHILSSRAVAPASIVIGG